VSQRALPLCLLLVVAGALMLMAAFAPSARADLIAYFNFQDSIIQGPPDFASESDQGLGVATTIGTNINSDAVISTTPGLTLNRWPTDQDPQQSCARY
jgi:hypothetical protein